MSEVLIADVVFAYNNTDLIDLLRQRGKHIKNQDWDKVRKTEGEI